MLVEIVGKIANINTELVLVRRRYDSSVGDVTMLRTERRRKSGSILGRGKRFFLLSRTALGPIQLLLDGYGDSFPGVKVTIRLHLPRLNEWSYISQPPSPLIRVSAHLIFIQRPHSETFPHERYRFNIIASSDPNITTSPHKRCAIYTDEEKTSRYYIQKSG
jgi:hypothetical protein